MTLSFADEQRVVVQDTFDIELLMKKNIRVLHVLTLYGREINEKIN